ncbi:Nitrate/nitrite transporter NarK [Natronorubrum sediminis]|uniref:Nitrate/nitrite transporter NarK n=1 Tax=Natronorubrum sediminis TaxID=640943 RepID=A0A1H6G544_9EURY|nr:MFS transporter [Natronorubrum sediminis]SEH18201.1 Nitrate/nitrite transporter NarK [Natronorubrum sediminis]
MLPDPRRAIAERVYYGWIIVIGALLATTAVYGTSYAFGVFYDVFIEEFDVSRSVLAGVFGLQTALIYIVGVGAGRAVDRYGQRAVAAVSSALFTGGLVWAALSRSYLELFAAYGFLTAIGMGGLFVVSFATIPLWFETRRATASGIASAGLGIGMVVFPLGTELLISSAGWRQAMFGIALLAGILCITFTAFFVNRPSEVGADASVEFDGGESPFETIDARSTQRTSLASNETITSRPFLLVFLGWVLLSMPIYIVISHVVSYATVIGIGRSQGVLALTTVGVAATVARFGVGILADRVGRTRTFIACTSLLGAAMVAIAFAPTPAVFLGTIVIFGVGYGGCGSLFSPLVADLFGHEDLNTSFAVMSLSFAVAGLAAPPLVGYWFEITGSYTGSFLLAGLGAFIGAGCVAVASRLN